jgi:heterodisulfide reductase subunit B
MEALGITLEELPQWQCCGAVYPQARDEIATKLSSVRALAAARDLDRELVTLCSACHHVIKRVNGDMRGDEYTRSRANNYLKLDRPYVGETTVLHYLEVLRDRLGFDELQKRVVKPLTGRRIGGYYGCLLLRPSGEMGFDDPENPSILEDFLRAIGAGGLRHAQRVLRRLHHAGEPRLCRRSGREGAGQRRGLRRGGADHRLPPVPV